MTAANLTDTLQGLMHAVVIGDVAASRNSPNRKALQQQLTTAVDMVNRRAQERNTLLSPYTITLGDEVQSVYANPSEVALDILAFQAQLSPVRMRFCVGLGAITTKLNRQAAIGMDGPAFYSARDGIESLKADPTSSLAVRAESNIDVALEDAAIRLIHASMASWRATRFKVLLARLQHTEVKQIALDLGISVTATYRNISDGRIPLLTDAAAAIGASLCRKTTARTSGRTGRP